MRRERKEEEGEEGGGRGEIMTEGSGDFQNVM